MHARHILGTVKRCESYGISVLWVVVRASTVVSLAY